MLPTLLAHASEEQKRAWIPKILSGEEIWVQLLSEPAAGSDLAGLLDPGDPRRRRLGPQRHQGVELRAR